MKIRSSAITLFLVVPYVGAISMRFRPCERQHRHVGSTIGPNPSRSGIPFLRAFAHCVIPPLGTSFCPCVVTVTLAVVYFVEKLHSHKGYVASCIASDGTLLLPNPVLGSNSPSKVGVPAVSETKARANINHHRQPAMVSGVCRRS